MAGFESLAQLTGNTPWYGREDTGPWHVLPRSGTNAGTALCGSSPEGGLWSMAGAVLFDTRELCPACDKRAPTAAPPREMLATMCDEHGRARTRKTTRRLAVLLERDPDPECEGCGGRGVVVFGDADEAETCLCCEPTEAEPTVADLLTDDRVNGLVHAVVKACEAPNGREDWNELSDALDVFGPALP